MADNYVKRPSDITDAEFDLRDFVTLVERQGVVPTDVIFRLRNEPGIEVTSTMPVPGLIHMKISGGQVGRVYMVGVEAMTNDGDSQIEMSRVRVRDPSLFETLPPGAGETVNTYVADEYVEPDYVS